MATMQVLGKTYLESPSKAQVSNKFQIRLTTITAVIVVAYEKPSLSRGLCKLNAEELEGNSAELAPGVCVCVCVGI